MRILLATTSYPRRKGDPAGIFVHNLARHLKLKGHDIVVIAPSCGMNDEEQDIDGIKVIRYRYFFRKWEVLFCRGGGAVPMLRERPYLSLLLPFAVFSYAISILKHASSCEIIQAEWSVSGFAAILAKIFLKKRIVVSLLGSDMMKAKSSFVYRFITKTAFSFSDAITAVSRKMMKEAVSFGAPKDKVFFIPYGTSEDFLAITPPHFQKPFNILYVGNLIKLKKVDVLLKAFAQLPENFRLYIVGNGIRRKELENLCSSLNIGGRVFFEGRKPHELIPEYLKKSHLLVLVSESEGRPNVVLEALAAGIPVIASDIPGNRELIKDMENGILVPVDDIDGLKRAILRVFSSENIWGMYSKRGKEFVKRERLLWNYTAEDHVKLYEHILKN